MIGVKVIDANNGIGVEFTFRSRLLTLNYTLENRINLFILPLAMQGNLYVYVSFVLRNKIL